MRPNKRIGMRVDEINQSGLLLFKNEGLTRYRIFYWDAPLSNESNEFFRYKAVILLRLISIVLLEIFRNDH